MVLPVPARPTAHCTLACAEGTDERRLLDAQRVRRDDCIDAVPSDRRGRPAQSAAVAVDDALLHGEHLLRGEQRLVTEAAQPRAPFSGVETHRPVRRQELVCDLLQPVGGDEERLLPPRLAREHIGPTEHGHVEAEDATCRPNNWNGRQPLRSLLPAVVVPPPFDVSVISSRKLQPHAIGLRRVDEFKDRGDFRDWS